MPDNSQKIRRAKKIQAPLSYASGGMGVAGLGALALRKKSPVANKIYAPLTTTSVGVGSVGSFNFARLQGLESKHNPRKPRQNVYVVRNKKQIEEIKQGKRTVAKADRNKKQGAALLGVSGLAGTAAVRHNAISNSINSGGRKYYDRRINQAIQGAKRNDPRNALPKDSIGRTVYSSPAQKSSYKTVARDQTKQAYRQVAALKAKRAKPLISGSGRSAILRGGAAVAVPTLWLGSRKLVQKSKYAPTDVDAAMVGAAAGAGGYQGLGYSMKPLDRRAEKKISSSDRLRTIQRQHQKDFKRPRNAKAGDPSWRPYFRNYPKELPGWRLKRGLAVATTGKTGVAATTAMGAAGAYGAARLSRKHRNSVKKNYGGTMDFGLSSVHQGTNIEISKAYNPEDRRYRRSERVIGAQPYVTGAAAAGAGYYGTKSYKAGRSAVGDFRSGLANEATRSRLVGAAKTKTKTNPDKIGAWKKAARHPGGSVKIASGLDSAKLAGKNAGAAAGLTAVAIGAKLGSDRIKSYYEKKGRTYRPLHRNVH